MQWVRGKCLGKGSYGSVFLAHPTTPDWPLLAVKSAYFRKSSSLMKERRILLGLFGSEGIVKCYGSCLSLEFFTTVYNLLMEFAPGGCLLDLINKTYGGKIPENDVRQYAGMILKGLSSIHKNGYVHCDLKPANILVFPSEQGLSQLKIADFGLAKELGERDLGKPCSFRGTPLYMSPESVGISVIRPALDIWSLGCVVIEMITGNPPCKGLGMQGLLNRLVLESGSPDIPENMSREGKDFLSKCFTRPYYQRWTADMLLNHPFIVGEKLT